MIVVDIRADVSKALRKLDDARQKQVPFATALALTRTAQYTKGILRDEIARSFNAPTPYTLDSLFIRTATKANLRAAVYVKDQAAKGNPAVRFLLPNVQGTQRNLKGFESLLIRNGAMPDGYFAVPGPGAQLDAFGNVPGATITKILSQLQSSRDYTANESAKGKTRKNRRQSVGRYFAIKPGGGDPRPPGIYERISFFGGGAVRLVFFYTRKRPQYTRRYRFDEVGRAAARGRFPLEFRVAMLEAMRTAR